MYALLRAGKPEGIRQVLEHLGTLSVLPDEAQPLRVHDQVALRAILARPEEFLAELQMILGRVGVKNAYSEAEERLAELMNRRDRWDLWARGLRLLGLRKLAASIGADVAAFDVALFQDFTVLERIAWMKLGALEAKSAPAQSVWQNVPDLAVDDDVNPDHAMLEGYVAAAAGKSATR